MIFLFWAQRDGTKSCCEVAALGWARKACGSLVWELGSDVNVRECYATKQLSRVWSMRVDASKLTLLDVKGDYCRHLGGRDIRVVVWY